MSDILNQDRLPCSNSYHLSVIINVYSPKDSPLKQVFSIPYPKLKIESNAFDENEELFLCIIDSHLTNSRQKRIFTDHWPQTSWNHVVQTNNDKEKMFCSCSHCAMQFALDTNDIKFADNSNSKIFQKIMQKGFMIYSDCYTNLLMFKFLVKTKPNDLLEFYCDHIRKNPFKHHQKIIQIYCIICILLRNKNMHNINLDLIFKFVDDLNTFIRQQIKHITRAQNIHRFTEIYEELVVTIDQQYMIQKKLFRFLGKSSKKLNLNVKEMQKYLQENMSRTRIPSGSRRRNYLRCYLRKQKQNQLCSNPICKYSKQLSGGKIDMKICGGCKLLYFCSRKCQKYTWNRLNHRFQCIKVRPLY
eukprot:506669_1